MKRSFISDKIFYALVSFYAFTLLIAVYVINKYYKCRDYGSEYLRTE